MNEKQIALDNEILRILAGSNACGMQIEDVSDRDEMGVYVETKNQVIGLEKSSGSYVFKTAGEGNRSGVDDIDFVSHGLRKFVSIAADGNPSMLMLIWADSDLVLNVNDLGRSLQQLGRQHFVTRSAGQRFLGYLDGQRQRMVGQGKHQSRVPNRPELIEKYGYDVKYASHALRLGLQGIELMRDHRLSLPMRPDDLARAMNVKLGRVPFEEALAQIDDVKAELFDLVESTDLPRRADMDAVNDWLVQAHEEHWSASRG